MAEFCEKSNNAARYDEMLMLEDETDLRRVRGWNLLDVKNMTLCWSMCAEYTPIPRLCMRKKTRTT